jgi:hypothetical protein
LPHPNTARLDGGDQLRIIIVGSLALLLSSPSQAQSRYKSGESVGGQAAENSDSKREQVNEKPNLLGSIEANKDEATQVERSAEKYQRKTLLYFGAKPLGFEMWGLAALSGTSIFKVRWLSEMVGNKVGKATRLKRFDFVDLPWGTRPTLSVLRMFSEYINAAKENKAEAEAEYLERYKTYDIKASDLDRIMNSAYYYETELTKARIERFAKKVCHRWVTKKVKGKSRKTCAQWGKERVCVAYARQNGKKKCVKYKTKWRFRCRLAARTDFYHLLHRHPFSQRFAWVAARSKVENETPRQACVGAANSIASSISLQMRRIEEFRLKAPVIDTRKQQSELGFNLGTKEGLRIDQGMYIVEYDAQNRRKKIGYSRVREVGNNTKTRKANSWAQRLTGRGGLGKQLLEDPSRGASFSVGYGTNLNLNVAGNMGYITNSAGLSETWLYLSAYIPAAEQSEIPFVALGFKKLWYTGRYGVGFRLGAGFSSDENSSAETVLIAPDAQGVVELMFGGWGALQLQGGLAPTGAGGSVGMLFHY